VLEFKVLGRLRVLVDGKDVPVTDAVDRILLMGLLVNANTVVDPVQVVGSVWDHEPDLPASALESADRLRAMIDELPGTTRLTRAVNGYQLTVDEELIDYSHAKGLYLAAKLQAPMQRAERLREAFALWPETFEPDVAWSREVDALMQQVVNELEEAVTTISKTTVMPDPPDPVP
jgi:DNA-binding SARP family transcriptional activator